MGKEPKHKVGDLVFYENYWIKWSDRVTKVLPPKGREGSPSLWENEYHYVLEDKGAPQGYPESQLTSHKAYHSMWAARGGEIPPVPS